jgi:anti-anti-sigma factor
MDSSGIGELVAGFTDLSNRGGALKLVNLTRRVKDLLQMTQVLTIFAGVRRLSHSHPQLCRDWQVTC